MRQKRALFNKIDDEKSPEVAERRLENGEFGDGDFKQKNTVSKVSEEGAAAFAAAMLDQSEKEPRSATLP